MKRILSYKLFEEKEKVTNIEQNFIDFLNNLPSCINCNKTGENEFTLTSFEDDMEYIIERICDENGFDVSVTKDLNPGLFTKNYIIKIKDDLSNSRGFLGTQDSGI